MALLFNHTNINKLLTNGSWWASVHVVIDACGRLLNTRELYEAKASGVLNNFLSAAITKQLKANHEPIKGSWLG